MPSHMLLSKSAVLLLGLLIFAVDWGGARRRPAPGATLRWGIGALAAANLAFLVFLWVDHVRFPWTLDLMEFTVLQHVQRMVAHQFVYVRPEPGFVALAYNPLYYVLALPFVRALGESLTTLRLLSILGTLGAMAVTFAAVRARTRSTWWGLVAAGLFAAAYKAMDAYLDTAHSDSWLIFSALLGTWILDRWRSHAGRLLGILCLVASFWFKQHGALFALGGIAFLTMRDGWRKAAPGWILLVLLGPVLYVAWGNALFGPYFHRFTWAVPHGWSVYDAGAVVRLVGYILFWYGALALAAAVTFIAEARARGREMSVWHFQLIPALLTGAMGALDAGSSNNVFICMGAWLIVVGVMGLAELPAGWRALRGRLAAAGALLSFALLAYNPLLMLVSPRAGAEYSELLGMLRRLPGTVYAPWVGQLPGGFRFWPAAHWVALEDWRGLKGSGTEPIFREVCGPAIAPPHPAWMLTNADLTTYPCFTLLHDRYVMVQDLGDRFEGLQGLPKRWHHKWPRYLYRYQPPIVARVPAQADSTLARSSAPEPRRSAANVRPRASATPTRTTP